MKNHLNRLRTPIVPAGIPKNGVHMMYNDDCDVLGEKYFPDDTLVGLGTLLKFLAGSLQKPTKSTVRTLGPCKSETTRNFLLVYRYVVHQDSTILKSILYP